MFVMKNTFWILTIILVLFGFAFPVVWIGAVISGFIAISAAPEGRRLDGKKRTGGLLGGVLDDFVVGMKMMDCPYCKSKIMRDAQKCANCGEWLKKD